MRQLRLFALFAVIGIMAALSVHVATAGNAHFVGTPSFSTSGNTATLTGKVAGLGNISQIHVEVVAEAACVNRGRNKPQAENKQTVEGETDAPVQNGKANFSVELAATFQPDCSPPMTVEWTLISITVFDDEGNQLIP
jgi:hypothetical protein